MCIVRGVGEGILARGGRGGLWLALLLGLALASPAGASAAAGTIEGTVTDASTHAAIAGIEVCAYTLESEGTESVCSATKASGTYAIALAPGKYVVEFSSPFGSGLNYVTVYQGGAASLKSAEASPLTVTAGASDTGVDAAMHQGGHIEGRVAEAEAPGFALERIEVCAVGGEGFGCALTSAGGKYVISALPTGKYLVHFEAAFESDFLPQFYSGSQSAESATLVPVKAEETTKEINALLGRGGEIAGEVKTAPTGTPLEGARACALTSETEAIECAFTNEQGRFRLRRLPPGSYAVGFSKHGYQWQYYPSGRTFSLAQRILVAPGAGVGLQPTTLLPVGYVAPPPVGPVPPPQGAAAPSTAAAPVPAPAAGVAGETARSPALTISTTRLRASHGHVTVSLACANANCTGTLSLTVRTAYRVRRHGRSVTLHRTVVLAQGGFALAAGAHAMLSLRETSAGRARLAHAAHATVLAQLLGSTSGGAALTLGVRIS